MPFRFEFKRRLWISNQTSNKVNDAFKPFSQLDLYNSNISVPNTRWQVNTCSSRCSWSPSPSSSPWESSTYTSVLLLLTRCHPGSVGDHTGATYHLKPVLNMFLQKGHPPFVTSGQLFLLRSRTCSRWWCPRCSSWSVLSTLQSKLPALPLTAPWPSAIAYHSSEHSAASSLSPGVVGMQPTLHWVRCLQASGHNVRVAIERRGINNCVNNPCIDT